MDGISLYRMGARLDMTPNVTAVRVLDVLAIGPLLVLAAFWPGVLPLLVRGALAVVGVATIAYNARRLPLGGA